MGKYKPKYLSCALCNYNTKAVAVLPKFVFGSPTPVCGRHRWLIKRFNGRKVMPKDIEDKEINEHGYRDLSKLSPTMRDTL